MSSWTQSSVSLSKLHETQKPLNDKSGLGFNIRESSFGETSTQSNLVYDKFKKMNFVKASVIHNTYESVKYDDQTSGQLNQNGKAGIGYIRPENSKPSWLKNRLDKEKARANSRLSVPHQPRRGPKKVKSVWRKVQPQRDLNGPHTKPKLNRSHPISAHTLMDFHTGKTVKLIQVWVPKGLKRCVLMSRLVPAARICCVVREIQSLVLSDQLLTDRMTFPYLAKYSPDCCSLLRTLGCCSPRVSPVNSRSFRPPFGTFEVALDSSREALPFHTTFGGCCWLEQKHEVAV
ncbi:anthocyanidin 3-O-glucosyltransferase 2-like [Dorcoceras hygrometricum]|uniref:Anthocyanidin 3-O-glucosyltransferase 2-like n=1 Tax=Dorcoceras hygrometricum TaxID=472368 RepID=A0A2Z7CHY9_9LAMI|nr:anthocyanidin 3-O-glucosyltransferase 2-like [Dorcoceras hygrometricum]